MQGPVLFLLPLVFLLFKNAAGVISESGMNVTSWDKC